MTSTEEKLARELGFRVTELGDIDYNEHYRLSGAYPTQKLWRKCLELTEQLERLEKQRES